MRIIIKHTRQGQDHTVELRPRHALSALKLLAIAGASLWLLQQTVPSQASGVSDREALAVASSIEPGAMELAGMLASPVPEGIGIGASESESANWLADATRDWLSKGGGEADSWVLAPAGQPDFAAPERLLERPQVDAQAAIAALEPRASDAAVGALAEASQALEQARAEAADASQDEASEARVREHIDMLARKVGELEARLTQIDALGERLAGVAGVDPETFDFRHVPGQGGLLVESSPMSLGELDREVDALRERLAERGDYLSVIDARLTSQAAVRLRMPSAMPIRDYSYNSSSYGPRVDPITGRRAFHEGLDFAAPRGTPITAAAGGVVVAAHYHGGYGRMVEIDHGNKLVTRYAHASKLLVKPGDLVYRGQKIATVGSTGRSTGPHLHFEVRVDGQAADPRLFLAGGGATGEVLAAAGARQ